MKIYINPEGEYLIGFGDGHFLNMQGHVLTILPQGYEHIAGVWTVPVEGQRSFARIPCRRDGCYGFANYGEAPPRTEYFISNRPAGYYIHVYEHEERVYYWSGTDWLVGKGSKNVVTPLAALRLTCLG
ncbi:MAG: hypothetical protein KGI50_07420 [Patescibacteria group bacterium]|nr:hypothetical protein [Patescibacteria group bacterium]MDE2438786.1 hypothetical protein [Patescibacteria group bacterium]